jgi:hypothetical protein
MTRYKDQHRTARIEVEFPHHVDIIVPPGGSRGSMRCTPLTPSTASSHSPVGGKNDADGSIIRWCFADAKTAKAFAADFGIARGTFF